MPTSSDLVWCDALDAAPKDGDLLVLGRKSRLRDPALLGALGLPADAWSAMLDRAEPGDQGTTASTWVGARRFIAAILPDPCSRHNPPSRSWAIPALAKKLDGTQDATLVLALEDPSYAFASALAVARAFPLFQASSGAASQRTVRVAAIGPDGPVTDPRIPAGMAAVRYAARLTDMPTNLLHTDAMVAEALRVAQASGAAVEIIQGSDLRDQGFGGLWGVGKAASRPPALVALRHNPEGAQRTVAWVGKGIVYDTGGLSIKDRNSMPGMKGDMAGSAAVLAAFEAAVANGFPDRLVAVLCIAENSVGPESTRPDDVLVMRSGKTVEVNNTDAEGRLVLADGLSWVIEKDQPSLVVDLATLTGAALVSTGKVHAGVYCNQEAVERAVIRAGLASGEPVHPMVYAPELFRQQFRSPVADMKNSVKDRMNAQSSCAAQFIANHLPDPAPPWIHVDMAGPSGDDEGRGSGYGVGLLLELGSGPA